MVLVFFVQRTRQSDNKEQKMEESEAPVCLNAGKLAGIVVDKELDKMEEREASDKEELNKMSDSDTSEEQKMEESEAVCL